MKTIKNYGGLTNGMKVTMINPLTNERDIECRIIGMYQETDGITVINAQSINSPKIYTESFA